MTLLVMTIRVHDSLLASLWLSFRLEANLHVDALVFGMITENSLWVAVEVPVKKGMSSSEGPARAYNRGTRQSGFVRFTFRATS